MSELEETFFSILVTQESIFVVCRRLLSLEEN